MPSGQAVALEAADISVSGHTLLRDISLRLQPGSLTVIRGPGACGKSSLLRVFWGALCLERGTVLCRGRDMTGASSRSWSAWRRQVGILCDDFSLLDDETVFANVAIALCTMGRSSKKTTIDRTNRELSVWGLLHKRHSPTRLLAQGERVRLALARAFVRGPVAAFLDEPLAQISGSEHENVWGIIRQQAVSGTAIVVATSAGENRVLAADKVYEIEGGQIHLRKSRSVSEMA